MIWILPVHAATRHRTADIVGYRYNDESWWVLDTPLEEVDLTGFVERSEELKEILERERRSPGYARSFYADRNLVFGKTKFRAIVRLLFRAGKLMDIRIEGETDKPALKDLLTYFEPRYRKCEHEAEIEDDLFGGAFWKDADGDWLTVSTVSFADSILIRYTRTNADDEPPWHFTE
jgi:hypothetical protein